MPPDAKERFPFLAQGNPPPTAPHPVVRRDAGNLPFSHLGKDEKQPDVCTWRFFFFVCFLTTGLRIRFIPAGVKRIVTTNAGGPEELLPPPRKRHDWPAMMRRATFVPISASLIRPLKMGHAQDPARVAAADPSPPVAASASHLPSNPSNDHTHVASAKPLPPLRSPDCPLASDPLEAASGPAPLAASGSPLPSDTFAAARAEIQHWWGLHQSGCISADEYRNVKIKILAKVGI